VCENLFEGGGWLQVRYVSSDPVKWHHAQDGLRGTDVYGFPGASEYSIYFKNLMQPSSELLFVVGMYVIYRFSWDSFSLSFFFEGNFKHWLITSWLQVYNGGETYNNYPRTAFKSSINPSSCIQRAGVVGARLSV
jgi:hypothetical protein